MQSFTRLMQPSDIPRLAELRHALWPDGSIDEHREELEDILRGEWSETYPYVVLVAERDDALVGFAEVTLRSRAEGCDPTQPAGFLEGWYVADEWRRKGIGAALMRAAEEWARAQGCIEMGSDTWLDNELSQKAHEALGYEEVERLVCFYRKL